ncbi:MAG: hypothetical protein JOS17DRAFT_325512 [Linnemannia elongata]|nr:MAG: hypothetical protein JOS17DRAFT_325512 [Linnemannia elongata]
MANHSDDTTTPQPPTFASSYSAMSRALDMPEISNLIRQDLRGFHLKSAVLVCKHWWCLFAPYLWERVFIDAELDEKDREVLVRNGLAARSLTLSIYDPEDREGIVEYVVDRCRNVEALHLKLFSPEVVVVDEEAMERRLREAWENDGAGGKDADQERQFGIRSECKTDLLDSLLSKLPYVSELSLSIAHEDLKPEVLWCVPVLTRLRKLTITGGLSGNGYIVHKNRLCDWDLILRTSRECKYLNSLSVSWESHKTQDVNLNRHISKVSEMFESLEFQESSATSTTDLPVPKSEQFPSLRTLAVSSCEMHLSQMDFFYRSCPNLRAVEFKSVQASTHILERNLKCLALSCPNLLSFKFLDACKDSNRIDYSTTLLASPRSSLHSLTLSVITDATATVFGNNPAADNDYTHSYYKDDAKWTPPPLVTSLNIRDIRHPSVLLDTIASTPAGLTHLTIDGFIEEYYRPRYPYYYSQPTQESSQSLVERLYKLEKDPLLRSPTFKCSDTLQYLDVSTLEVSEFRKLYKILFWRVQELKGLRFLKMGREHVLAANLELTWSDDTLVGEEGDDDDIQTEETAETVMTTTEEGEDENSNHSNDTIEVEQEEGQEVSDGQDREKVFIWFPTVEHLYLVDTESIRYHSRNPFLTQHQASALVRMMPRLKVMSFNREDARVGLEGIIEACPKVSFNFMMRQK